MTPGTRWTSHDSHRVQIPASVASSSLTGASSRALIREYARAAIARALRTAGEDQRPNCGLPFQAAHLTNRQERVMAARKRRNKRW